MSTEIWWKRAVPKLVLWSMVILRWLLTIAVVKYIVNAVVVLTTVIYSVVLTIVGSGINYSHI